ncbi:MAG: sigma-70 family RNA polymerase sigma factor [Planctomycetes bacterium]|nr:sigma-70 family RNA polymerase sigma factor [Planctomycetota bacterium]
MVSRYQARLYNAALRLVQSPDDAADVVQDAFLNAYQSLHSFKGDAEFFTWLYRIAFNTAISLKRKKRPSVSLESHAGDTGIDPDDPSEYVKPGAALERTEEERQLREALARLSAEHREVLLLKDIEGMKYEEIAEVLGVPIGTIRSRLHRARLELRDLLVPLEERGTDEQPVPDVLTKTDEKRDAETDTPTTPRKGFDDLDPSNGERPAQSGRVRRTDRPADRLSD